jgi:hypothetical protein
MVVYGPGSTQDPTFNSTDGLYPYTTFYGTIIETHLPSASCIPPPTSGGPPTYAVLHRAATRQLGYAVNAGQKNWIAQLSLKDLMVSDTALDTNATLRAFRQMADSSSRYSYIESLIYSIGAGDFATANILLAYPTDSLLNTDSSATTGAVLADDTTADNIVNNYKEYYRLLIKFTTDTLNSADSAEITTMAGMCPQIDGAVILQVRGLYALIYNNYKLWSDISCDSLSGGRYAPVAPGGSTQNRFSNQQYFLSPNPNDGSFTLQQLVPNTDPVSAEIVNATGECVLKGHLTFEGGSTNLIMPNKVPGLYMLRITDSKGNSSTLKFVIE